MKKYIIKYEDTSGILHIEEYKTWDISPAISLLKHPCKYIYMIIKITSENTIQYAQL